MSVWKSMCIALGLAALGWMTACGGTTDTNCTTSPTFEKCVAPILTKSCLGTGCHVAEGSAAGLSLENITAADLVGKAGKAGGGAFKQVVAGKPDESLLYLKVLEEKDRPASAQGKSLGAAMPLGTLKSGFTPGDVSTIKLWIEKGAK